MLADVHWGAEGSGGNNVPADINIFLYVGTGVVATIGVIGINDAGFFMLFVRSCTEVGTTRQSKEWTLKKRKQQTNENCHTRSWNAAQFFLRCWLVDAKIKIHVTQAIFTEQLQYIVFIIDSNSNTTMIKKTPPQGGGSLCITPTYSHKTPL